jgi:putative transcriptional regulator
MSDMRKPMFHTVKEEWLAAYAAGALSPAKQLVLACQAAIQPALAGRLSQLDAIGGEFLEAAKGEPLSEGFSARLDAAIDDADIARPAADHLHDGASEPGPSWAPSALRDFLQRRGLAVNWRNAGPGVQRARLFDSGGERLYLLKARPGLKMPMHSHKGEEWTLVLQGGYHAGDDGFGRGDLHQEDQSCTHQPIIDDDGEDCISLVADEGRLKFSDPLLKLIQPLIGI